MTPFSMFVALQPVLQGGVALDAADVELGTFDYATRLFTPGRRFGSAAIRVVARRRDGAHPQHGRHVMRRVPRLGPLQEPEALLRRRERSRIEATLARGVPGGRPPTHS